jgi:hypothetical protein
MGLFARTLAVLICLLMIKNAFGLLNVLTVVIGAGLAQAV